MAKGLRRFRYTRKKGRGKALLLLAAALFTGGTALSEWGLGSISEELTQEAARAYVLAQVNQAVEEALAQPRPFVTSERDGEGEPVAVQADTAALNELRLQVLGTLEESLNGSVTVEVPMGSSSGFACHRSPIMATQRFSRSAVMGYSSLSMAFFSMVSAMIFVAMGSM